MLKCLMIFVLFLSSLCSFAEGTKIEDRSAYRIHMALTGGINSPRGSIKSSAEFGLHVGFQPYRPFVFEVEVISAELGDSNLQRTSLLVRWLCNLGEGVPFLRTSYFGATTGPMFIDDGDVEWSMGPLVGFDVPLKDKSNNYLSLGLQGKYLWTTGSQDSFSGGVVLKYWY